MLVIAPRTASSRSLISRFLKYATSADVQRLKARWVCGVILRSLVPLLTSPGRLLLGHVSRSPS